MQQRILAAFEQHLGGAAAAEPVAAPREQQVEQRVGVVHARARENRRHAPTPAVAEHVQAAAMQDAGGTRGALSRMGQRAQSVECTKA